jgi:hypothetical protein
MYHLNELPIKLKIKASEIGMWRSLVAYTSGGRRVAGSNPVIPTSTKSDARASLLLFYSNNFPRKGTLQAGEKTTKVAGDSLQYFLYFQRRM